MTEFGKHSPNGEPTVGETVKRYLRHCEATRLATPDGMDERRRVLGAFVKAYCGLAVSACRAFQLTDFIESRKSWKSSSTRAGVAHKINACFN
jgi:hypothetical protein